MVLSEKDYCYGAKEKQEPESRNCSDLRNLPWRSLDMDIPAICLSIMENILFFAQIILFSHRRISGIELPSQFSHCPDRRLFHNRYYFALVIETQWKTAEIL